MTLTAVPTATIQRHPQWIDGKPRASADPGTVPVIDPATEQVVAVVPAGSPRDVDAAVAAARRAQPGWAGASLAQRFAVLGAVIDLLEAHADELADLVTCEVGAPIRVARQAQVGLALGIARSFLGVAGQHAFQRRIGNSLVVDRPLGVAGCITPWNMPLLLALQKIAPALVAGCTVVHKPSELTPLSALRVAELASDAGLPPGVLNVVVGTGPNVGEALAAHPGVDVLSLTGSTRAGRRVAALGAANLTPVHLELGGKSASIVLDDADLELAVRATVEQVCFNTGQTCLQWSRLLVPRARYAEAVQLAASAAGSFRIGDPRDPATDLGPLVSAQARDRVRGHIRAAVDAGAQLVVGGVTAPTGLERGWFVQPTVLADVTPSMRVAREEVFGPVLSVMVHDGDDNAIAIANDTRYGLHGAVWSASDERALRVGRSLRTGQVDINGGPFNPLAPFGGFGESGVGRECGAAGLEAYLAPTSFQLPDEQAPITGPRLRGVSS